MFRFVEKDEADLSLGFKIYKDSNEEYEYIITPHKVSDVDTVKTIQKVITTYTIPQSVESFYQEAGRAGRDRIDSYNLILYSNTDVENSLDFIKNAHKGAKREYLIFDELLTEVKYEDLFFVKYISTVLREKFTRVNKINLWKNKNGNWYLYINGKWIEHLKRSESLGKIYIKKETELIAYADADYCTEEESNKICDQIIKYLKENCRTDNYVSWLQTKQADGIETILRSSKGNEPKKLIIGLANDKIEELGKKIGDIKYYDSVENKEKISYGSRIIKAAYNFCNGETENDIEEEFIEKLKYEHFRERGAELLLSNSEVEYYKKNFWLIRNSLDTQKAIYRLSILGVLDDYTIYYANDSMVLFFSAKSDEAYLFKFKEYLSRYLGNESVNKRIEKAQARSEATALRRYLNELVDFFEETLTAKRIKAAEYMDHLVSKVFLEKGENEFRRDIDFYFKSKYARSQFFPTDFEHNNISVRTFHKYIDFIFNPPDGLGKEYDNLQHIKGACARYVQANEYNPIVELLSSFSNLILEAKIWGHLADMEIRYKNLSDIAINTFKTLSDTGINSSDYFSALNRFTHLLIAFDQSLSYIANNVSEISGAIFLNARINKLKTNFLSRNERSIRALN